MMARYYGLIEHADNDCFSVVFPDFPECSANGRTPEEAWRQAERALRSRLGTMRQEGASLPSPKSLEEIAPGRKNGLHDILFVRC